LAVAKPDPAAPAARCQECGGKGNHFFADHEPVYVSAATHRWQRPILDLFDRLRTAGPDVKVSLVHGRKRDRLVIVDRDGKVIEP